MPTLQQLTSSQSSPEVPINENFETLEHAAVYGKKQSTTTGLVWGYYGGRWGGFSVVDGTFTLTASSTNYIVVAKATGVTTASTSNTNWNDATNYARVYLVTTSASAVTAVQDHRSGPGGAHGGAGTGGGGSGIVTLLEYTASSTTTDSDPGTGTLRWDNATQASATQLFIDNVDADSTSQATLWAGLPSGSYLRITEVANGDVWQLWKVTATPVNGTGYYKFTVSLQAQEGGNIANTTAVLLSLDAAGGGGGLTNFTDGINTSAPNATVPVVQLLATNAATNVDVALTPKGTGALSAHVATSSSTGGNKRGTNSVDWQSKRTTAAQAATGAQSTIAGGENNTSSGADTTVGGGIGNTASSSAATVAGGNANTASGTNSTIAGGSTNTATGQSATVAGGTANNATGANYPSIGGGATNTASGDYSTIGGGTTNTASGNGSTIPGGREATTRGLYGAYAWSSGGLFSTVGANQYGRYLAKVRTTDATPTTLALDGGSPAAATTIALPNSSVYAFSALVSARQQSATTGAGWTIVGTIRRDANAGTTTLVGSPTVTSTGADAGAATWTVAAVANTTRGSLEFTVTGEAAKTIRWTVVCETSETME